MDLTPAKARNNFKLDLSHKHWDDLRGFLKDFFRIVDKTARQAEAALAYEYTIGVRGKGNDLEKSAFQRRSHSTDGSSNALWRHHPNDDLRNRKDEFSAV
jgi:hypothetical protein